MLLDILPEIFGNLSVKDKLRCRQVCRAWQYVVDRDFPEELCLYVKGIYAPDVWMIDCKPIDPRSAVTVNSLAVLADPNFIKLFGNLKRLMIKCVDSRNKNSEMLTSLGQLDQLEHLELHGVSVGKDLELNLDGLKKFYLNCGEDSYPSSLLASPLPRSLEIFGQSEWAFSNPFKGLENQLKVLITKRFSDEFVQLTNLERLHVTFLSMEDEKPRRFVGRLPKLLLLDIFHIDLEEHMNELLEEVASLKPARNVKFYHNGIDSSAYVNEKLENPEKDLFGEIGGWMNGGGRIDLKRVLYVGQQNPEMVLPFFHFQHTFILFKDREISLSRPIDFGIFTNRFRNINKIGISKISIDEILSYDELRTLLTNFRHLLCFTITCEELDHEFDRFFGDLPAILENLVILGVLTGDRVLERLNFLDAFKHLLGFAANWRENEENRRIIQTIEKRKKNMKYPILAEAFKFGYICEQKCTNFFNEYVK